MYDLCVDMCDVCVTSPAPARGASLHLGCERNLGSFVLLSIASANVFANVFANVVANAFANAFAKVVTNAFCSEGGEVVLLFCHVALCRLSSAHPMAEAPCLILDMLSGTVRETIAPATAATRYNSEQPERMFMADLAQTPEVGLLC